MKTATCFAPATVANVAVGFDILGFSFPLIGDEITVTKTLQQGVTIDEVKAVNGLISESECRTISTDPEKNTATAGLLALLQERKTPFGFRVAIGKGIPLGSGMGGSASSAVGALVAANQFFDPPLSKERLFHYALVGEAVASGAKHGDNVAACLYGGLTLIRSMEPVDVVSLPLPPSVYCVVVHPHIRLDTRASRAVLKPELKLADHVKQSSNLAGLIAGCFTNDLALIGRSLSDVLIEPQRLSLIPAFSEAKSSALKLGALGCSISGSGPSIFAWAGSQSIAHLVQSGMVKAFAELKLAVDSWVSPLSSEGAHIRLPNNEGT